LIIKRYQLITRCTFIVSISQKLCMPRDLAFNRKNQSKQVH